MLFRTFTAIAALTVAGTAQASVIDFEDLSAGDILSNLTVDGVGVTISATGGSGDAMVFDSGNPTGGDADLGAPFYDTFTGSAPNGTPAAGAGVLNPGNILIISEDGDSSDPDDNGRGGTITFTFDSAVTFLGFDVLDDVDDFTVTADTGASIGGISLDYNNQFQSIGLNWAGVQSLTFDFGRASGAIDNIAFEAAAVPAPMALPLLLTGFGALGFAGRRRKAL